MCRLLVAGVAEDVFECAGGGAGRHAHHTVNIRPFEVQAGVGDFADFAVVKDNAALALVHGVHAAAGADEDAKDDSASGNQGDEGAALLLLMGLWAGFRKMLHDIS